VLGSPPPEEESKAEMAPSTGSTTLVLGGSGTLGAEVIPRLLEAGRAVRVMTRRAREADRLRTLGVECVAGDLIEPESVRAACNGVHAIVAAAHSLFGTGRHASEAVDGAGNERLFDIARAAGVRRVVFISVHGAHREHPTAFWRHKARAEESLRRSGLPHTILRPTAFMDFHAEVLIGKPIREKKAVVWFGRGDNPRNFVAAADVAKFVELGLNDDRSPSETLDVGGPENLSNLDVVRHYERSLQRQAKVIRLPRKLGKTLRPVLGLLHTGIANGIECALAADELDLTLDGAAAAAAHGIRLTTLSDWLERRSR
jgi:uncharacterized protein YbjT (DUF2867 family)